MRNTFEVHIYEPYYSPLGPPGKCHYEYKQIWQGESLLQALWTMWKQKRKGLRCINLTWRP